MTTPKMRIGRFVKGSMSALEGSIGALGLGTFDVMSQDAKSANGKAYLRLIADPMGTAFEIGAAFPRVKDGKDYYSVNLESPVFPAPINAALFPDRDNPEQFDLICDRPDAKPGLTHEAGHPTRRFVGANVTP